MSLTNNRLSVTTTQAQIATVKAAFATIFTTLPFLIGLTPEEREKLPKIDVTNKVFTEDAIKAINNNGNFLPSYFSGAETQKDLDLFDVLDEFVLLSAQLYERLRDTQILAGSEAYVSALTAYRLIAAAAAAGVPGADSVYQSLKKRFTDKSSNPPV